MAQVFLFFTMTGARKSWLSCLLKRSEVKLIPSERGWWRGAGKGLRGSDLLIVRGMIDCEGRLRGLAPVNYEENRRRQEVAPGGRAIFVTTWCSFQNLETQKGGQKNGREMEELSIRGLLSWKCFRSGLFQMQVGCVGKLMVGLSDHQQKICMFLPVCLSFTKPPHEQLEKFL